MITVSYSYDYSDDILVYTIFVSNVVSNSLRTHLRSKFAIGVTNDRVVKDLRVLLHPEKLKHSASVATVIIRPNVIL